MLPDLLEPISARAIQVTVPAEARARRVAAGISARPADRRTLAEWGQEVGASSRTLARAFVNDTGLPFGRWRSLVRMRAAMAALAKGGAISSVAIEVGFESTSAFVAAFRRETGSTPAAYFRGRTAGPRRMHPAKPINFC
jgi:AraC-like DNA-binding protein